jgi:bacterioferritin
MQGDSKLIQYLNQLLFNELTAINQSYLHAKMFKHAGYHKLATYTNHIATEKMQHADNLMERILLLHGLPNLQNLGKLLIGETFYDMLACDLQLEKIAIPVLQNSIKYAEGMKDYSSRDLIQHILLNAEQHADWLETQLTLFKQLGEQLYLQSQI